MRHFERRNFERGEGEIMTLTDNRRCWCACAIAPSALDGQHDVGDGHMGDRHWAGATMAQEKGRHIREACPVGGT